MKSKRLIFFVLSLIVFSVFLGICSIFPIEESNISTQIVIDDVFTLKGQQIYRQGLGGFLGNENVTLTINSNTSSPFTFELLTYHGLQYTTTASDQNFCYSFLANADYYDTVFISNATESRTISLIVTKQNLTISYPFSCLSTVAKTLFFASCLVLMFLLLKTGVFASKTKITSAHLISISGPKNFNYLKIFVLLSLLIWLVFLVFNENTMGTFENWYTDAARHPYTSTLFTKVNFSVFNIPLGQLSDVDQSLYKFVTWPEMPHLYPLGSILLFLPFSILLEAGVAQIFVFKLEIALFLVAFHVCLFYFLKQFWKKNISR